VTLFAIPVSPKPSGVTFEYAFGINNDGQTAAVGCLDAQRAVGVSTRFIPTDRTTLGRASGIIGAHTLGSSAQENTVSETAKCTSCAGVLGSSKHRALAPRQAAEC
jgi:hypothetical protein